MPAIDVARVVIEFTSTHAVGTGDGDGGADAGFVRDANGLPTLPGTSIAGVLRHALEREARAPTGAAERSEAEERVKHIFGFQEQGRSHRQVQGQASRLRVSFASAHARDDRPVAPLAQPGDDPVLRLLLAGIHRDHVRIDARGVADARGLGKFDALVVPAGARFTFELLDTQAIDDALGPLLELLAGGGLRLGGKGLRGQGEFKVVAVRRRRFDFELEADRAAWATLRSALHAPCEHVLPPAQVQGRLPHGMQQITLRLEAVDYWMFGGGTASRPEHDDVQRQVAVRKGATAAGGPAAARTSYENKSRSIDMVPVTEPQVSWGANGGTTNDGNARVHPFVATGIKGALRHRASFWARAAAEDFSDDVNPPPADEPKPVHWLFGHAAAVRGDRHGVAGRVAFSEPVLTGDAAVYGRIDHVSLDRFTQGPYKGALYSEAPLFGGLVELRLSVDALPREGDSPGDRAKALAVLNRALRDLAEERLAVGAGSNRGHGYFRHVGPVPQFKVEA